MQNLQTLIPTNATADALCCIADDVERLQNQESDTLASRLLDGKEHPASFNQYADRIEATRDRLIDDIEIRLASVI